MIRGMEESTQTKLQYAVPGFNLGKSASWKKPVLIGLAVVIILVAAAFLITPIRAQLTHVWFYLTAPEEAKQLIVAGANPGEIGKFAIFTLSGREEMTVPVEGLIIDYAERNGVRIASVVNPTTMADELYLIGDEPTQLTEDRYSKTGIAISHDGSRIAFNAPPNKQIGAPYFSMLPEGWVVMVMDLETREIIEVGKGYGAQFVDAGDPSKIVYVSAEGLVAYDLDSGVSVTNDVVPPFSAAYPIRVSDDGTKALIFNPEQNRYGINTIDTTTLKHTLYAAIPDTFANAILTDTHAYWVKKGNTVAPSELWTLSLRENSTPRRLYTFFDGFTVSRVINRH